MNFLSDEFMTQIDQIKERLYRIAYSYFYNEADAIEAVDETVYQAYRSIKKLKHPEYFKTWITRILINVCKKELKRKKKIALVDEMPEQASEEYDRLPLKEAILKLPDELRVIIYLRYFNDLTVVETADILQLPLGTVATRQRKALKLLKLELEED
ncbi:MAG: polymerase subunit sigma-24 [Herbinix sp.]|jgi:RNA polymerase sigma-70 factor (ECF subfamily)|nr:polymerase subunit sigma-24 [Herbinix sp.]